MALLEFSYELWPESPRENVLSGIASMWEWMFENLESALKSINPNFAVDWTSFYLFGGSYGGEMAFLAWIMSAHHPRKPEGFFIRSVVCRAPTMKEYRRKPGPYAGIPISQERANEDNEKIQNCLAKLPCASREPPPEIHVWWTGTFNIKWLQRSGTKQVYV
ncbi:hypothetical protein GQ44DRAFT_86562 [Phaeosphaeriaceae sp. PMI808]|nr:hypothetical protein GQ44DRAFT_86562 [Phaeosphaeriaceae sp. PMI808]